MLLKNRNGSALPLVIIIMIVISILGLSFITVAVAENKFTHHQKNRMQAYYVARSGADTVAQYLIKNPEDAKNLVDRTVADYASGSIAGIGDFELQLSDTSTTGDMSKIKIMSVGMVNDVKNSSSVNLRLMKANEIFDKAIYTKSPLDISGMIVTGDVESGGKIEYSEQGNHKYSGTPTPYSTRTFVSPALPNPLPSSHPVYGSVIEVKKQNIDINDSYSFSKITVGNKGNLNINANDPDLNNPTRIVVDELTIDDNLNISGPGRVEIYVRSTMTITNKGVINNNIPDKLVIYLMDGSIMYMQSGKVFNGFIYGPDATVQIQSAHSNINGAVISNIIQKNHNNGPNGVLNYVAISSDIDLGSAIKMYLVESWEK